MLRQNRFGPDAQTDLRRREDLWRVRKQNDEELSHARAAVVQAQAALKAVEAEEVSAQTSLIFLCANNRQFRRPSTTSKTLG